MGGIAVFKPSMVLVLVMIAMLVSFPSLQKVQGCFISNCPVSGKKRESLEPQPDDIDTSCHGLCFMEGLCCAEGGCYLDSSCLSAERQGRAKRGLRFLFGTSQREGFSIPCIGPYCSQKVEKRQRVLQDQDTGKVSYGTSVARRSSVNYPQHKCDWMDLYLARPCYNMAWQ